MNGYNYEGNCMTVAVVSLFIYKTMFKNITVD